eukprot:469471-Amphidinium_carterae.1
MCLSPWYSWISAFNHFCYQAGPIDCDRKPAFARLYEITSWPHVARTSRREEHLKGKSGSSCYDTQHGTFRTPAANTPSCKR